MANYIATDLHKGYANLFYPHLDEASKARFIEGNLRIRFAYVDDHLSRSDYLLESGFSVADAYLYNILTWSPRVNVDLSPYAAIQRFMMRMGDRPTVRASLEAEGSA